MSKTRQKMMYAKDEILMMGHLLMKRKMWLRKIFLQRESHGAYNILWKELKLKDRESFFGNLYCDILFCSFVLHLR